jgi:hypothetical protein
MSDATLTDSNVPSQAPPTGNPGTVDTGRDLRAERDAELARERAAAAQKQKDRFTVKKITATSRPLPPAAPEYETLMYKTAVNFPLTSLQYPSISTFVPNCAPMFYVLHIMDHLMCSTRKWTENSSGWVPPISQMYISVLVYYQICRAMHAAGNIPGDLAQFLIVFERTYNVSELWIPGPLVSAFRALSAFRPDADDFFAGVTPTLPTAPGQTVANGFRFTNHWSKYLPNVNFFISRLRSITNVAATANMDDPTFRANPDGPLRIANLNGVAMANNGASQNMVSTPGINLSYGGHLSLWQTASRFLGLLNIPVEATAANIPAVNDTWTAAIRFENNEHLWFAPVAATMAKYCQFFNGSASMADVSPVCSAAAAVKARTVANQTTLLTHGTWVAAAPGPPAVAGHYVSRDTARFTIDAQVALRDVPDAHVY